MTQGPEIQGMLESHNARWAVTASHHHFHGLKDQKIWRSPEQNKPWSILVYFFQLFPKQTIFYYTVLFCFLFKFIIIVVLKQNNERTNYKWISLCVIILSLVILQRKRGGGIFWIIWKLLLLIDTLICACLFRAADICFLTCLSLEICNK